MKITIAGYGSIGRFVASVFEAHNEICVYDPPLGLGSHEDLVETDYVFVCVPTPALAYGVCDTSIVEEIVQASSPRKAIICHSTIAIGTSERLLQKYKKPFVFVPEYAGESPDHIYRDMKNVTFQILGGYEPVVSDVRRLFESAYGPHLTYRVVPPTVAETVKYMENSFFALKVAFCNEFFDLSKSLGIDYEDVRSAWLLDKRVDPSHTLVTAERGYGGKCLPKDIAAVCASARDLGSPMELLETVQKINVRHRSKGRAAAETAPR